MRVADYIADFLHREGVRQAFMLSGTGSIHLDDAFLCHPEIALLTARHESAAAVMAAGSHKLTGRLGAVVVTTGPGGLNAMSGVAEAWVDAVPVLVISGQVERRLLAGTRYFGVQGFDIVSAVRGFTKYAALVTEPASIRYHLEKAVHLARSARPGPTWLDIPADVQSVEIDASALEGFVADPPALPDGSLDAQLDEVVRLLEAAERPLLVLGQGVRHAGATAAFRELAESLRSPFVATRLAHDLIPYDTDGYLGQGGIRGRRHTGLAMERSDLVLSLGSSLAHGFVGEGFDAFAPDATVVMVDSDERELTKPGVHVDVPIRADVRVVIERLLLRLADAKLPDRSDWLADCRRLKLDNPTVVPSYRTNPINSYHFVERLEAHTTSRNVFVSDAGSAYYVTGQTLRFEHGERELTSGAFASMGVALPLAIGASFSDPDAEVLVVTGDGSIELNIQELRTISERGLAIKVFVINNGGYASIRDSQDAMCGGRYTEDQSVLCFRDVARAFELPFRLVEREETLDETLAQVLAEPGPALIEVVCDAQQEILRPLRSQPATALAGA